VTAPAWPPLQPGRVYRTRDMKPWTANAPRTARRLVREGRLVALAQGLYACPKRGRFGAVPATDEEILRAFLGGSAFIITGPDRWNALGLGTTAMFAMPLVYNTKRSGTFTFGGRSFLLRRVAFPPNPSPEWFVVDLFENAEQAGASRAELGHALGEAVGRGDLDRDRLREMAERFGTKATQAQIGTALESAQRQRP
jgi:hypothetical protein